MAKIIREQLIRLLAQGDFISGQYLGQKLGVSRAAISNHIKALTEIGLDIYSVTGKGYKLAQPISLLDEQKITAHLNTLGENNLIEVHNIIDSTNSYLLRKIPNQIEMGQVCIAEYQQQGRGRRGRTWQSPFASHLYLSLYWPLEQGMSDAMGLSLTIALAISDTIKHFSQEQVQLKWPNDIYMQGKKLAGVLIELEGQAQGISHCVIGVGLNINMPATSAKEIDQPWTDLSHHSTKELDRNLLSAYLIAMIMKRLKQHQEFGFSAMLAEWHQLDYFLNQQVKLVTGHKEIIGTYQGVNEQGALILCVDGKEQVLYGGEVSLRGYHESTG